MLIQIAAVLTTLVVVTTGGCARDGSPGSHFRQSGSYAADTSTSHVESGAAPLPGRWLRSFRYPTEATRSVETLSIGPPSAPLFAAGTVVLNAVMAPRRRRYPLIMLSQGSGGSAVQLAWLGMALARNGYIVAAGFSLGGHAVLALAGARTDLGGMLTSVRHPSEISRASLSPRCRLLRRSSLCSGPRTRVGCKTSSRRQDVLVNHTAETDNRGHSVHALCPAQPRLARSCRYVIDISCCALLAWTRRMSPAERYDVSRHQQILDEPPRRRTRQRGTDREPIFQPVEVTGQPLRCL